jgi:3-hydroxyacyl-CoA dehydrogenase
VTYRGGPGYYADTVGLKTIAERLAFYASQTGDTSLEPTPLLKSLADKRKTSHHWQKQVERLA